MESGETENFNKVDTPKKIIFSLNDSANDICILCFKHNERSRRLRLWSNVQKTKVCLDLEEYVGERLTKIDFKIICSTCGRSICNDIEKRNKRKRQLLQSREEAKKYLDKRIKRFS